MNDELLKLTAEAEIISRNVVELFGFVSLLDQDNLFHVSEFGLFSNSK